MRIFLSLLFVTFLSSHLFGAHIIGGEMTYECFSEDPAAPGNNIYGFTLKVYRDCFGQGAAFDSDPNSFTIGTVTIFQGNIEFITINLDAPEITDIDPDTGNPCVEVPTNVCVEEGVYYFELSLPIVQESYFITYQRCCRNAGIVNIFNPEESGATYTIELTGFAQQVCNNSPVFNNFPPPVICVNQALNFDHSATDAEGDLLVYELCAPLLGGSVMNVAPNPDAPPPYNPVNFITPTFTAQNPVQSDPQVTIDQFTGFITGTPNVQDRYVVGVCVSEFRNGQLLSRVQRDFQFNVTNCDPVVEAATDGAPEATKNFFYRTCNDTIITMINESGPLQNITGYEWWIYLKDTTLIFNDKDITVNFQEPGNYTCLMVLNPGSQCSDTANIFVVITPEIQVGFEAEYDTCVAGPVVFTDLVDTNEYFIVNRFWDMGDNNQLLDTVPIYQYEDPGDYIVQYTVSDSIGCTYSAVNNVLWFPAPPIIVVDPSTFAGCPPLEIFMENLSEPVDDTYIIDWEFGDGDSSSLLSPTHTYFDTGVYTINLSITSPIGCFIDTTYEDWISVYVPPVADFTFDSTGITNFNPEVQFIDQSSEDVKYWIWDFAGVGEAYEENPLFSFPDTGLQEVKLFIIDSTFCVDSITKVLDVVPKVTFYLPNAFSPNGDGENDEFLGVGFLRGLQDFHLQIWDRYGGLIFETDNPFEGWNGRHDNVGKLLQTGVYPVRVTYTEPRGKPIEIRGYATLLR